MIKTIIFDLGGVVLNRGIWLFHDYLAAEFLIPREKIVDVFIKTYYKPYFSGQIEEKEFWDDVLRDLGITADWKELRQKMLDFFEPTEGMFELLRSLRKKGYSLVLLSDQTKEWWPVLNEKHKIEQYFDSCIISAEVGVHKPDPAIYELALEKGGSDPENTIFIDDLEKNLPPAENLKMKTIFYTGIDKLKKDLSALGVSLEN